jgi:hypothetical protein
VELTTVTPLTVMPVPETATVLPVVKLLPARVTPTVVPRCATVDELGVTEASVAAGGLTTVNVTVPVVPIGVVTETFLAVRLALAAMTQFALTVVAVGVPVMVQVTFVPDAVTAVAPVRLVPVSVTGTVVPRAPVVGAIDASVGPVTVNELFNVMFPLGVTTVTFNAPNVAVFEIANVAVAVVSFTAVKPLTVTPVPDTDAAVAVASPVPVIVTGTLVPRKPVFGVTPVTVGATTVKVTVLLFPPGVVTVTVLWLALAVAAIVNVAVT